MRDAEFLDLAREVCRVHDLVISHLRERGLRAFQSSVSLWGVDLWVEVFFDEDASEVLVSFDLVQPLLAVDVAAMSGDGDTVTSRAASVTTGLWHCIKGLERNPHLLAAREAKALDAVAAPAAPGGAKSRRL